MTSEDDDRPTVVLDLNALKKQKIKQEEELANLVQDLEFAVGPDEDTNGEAIIAKAEVASPVSKRKAIAKPTTVKGHQFTVILFDLQTDFFEKSKLKFPAGFHYIVAKTLSELNKLITSDEFKIVVFIYDINPKAVNSLTAQIKQKYPATKTLIMAKAISPEKAKIHAHSASGANGYYQLPLDPQKIENELVKIFDTVKKVG